MSTKIEFTLHIISENGIKPDEKKFADIKEFPGPKRVWYVRAFFGLANQLASFVPNLAHMTTPIQPLLKKGATWIWINKQQEAFDKIKNFLMSELVINPFNPNMETILLTEWVLPYSK